MTCDQAIELLPWYLNGTLESGELAEVRQHLETCERCREALAETGQAWSVFAQHIPAQDMVALAWGERPSGIDPAAAEQHLAACAECTAELELARMSRRLEEESNVAVFPVAKPQMAPSRAYRGWRAAAIAASLAGLIAVGGWLQSARQPQQALVAPVAPPIASPSPAVQPQAPAGHDEAGGELAALRQKVKELSDYAEGLQGQVRKAQEQVAQRAEPRDLTASPWLSPYVSPTDVVRGEEGNAEIVTVPAKASLAVLPLRATHPETGAHENHEVVILSESGRPLKTRPIQRDPNGYYPLALAHDELRPGIYILQVYGMTGGKRDPEPSETYKIRLR
ncbi:MAG TPA: zf-HC2 domain-containing protein [Thermoanaerobaculia bacterium]|jgi:anti-sigma factor RsiW|nr:zf-HC2 domain-containing protein [Thermoanaerobaculia bacterium]